MTEQIQTHPKSFEVSKWFGPQTAQVILPDDALDALVKMTDNIIDNKKSLSHGNSLAGVIDKELRVYKSDMEKAGVDQLLGHVSKVTLHTAQKYTVFSKKNMCLRQV